MDSSEGMKEEEAFDSVTEGTSDNGVNGGDGDVLDRSLLPDGSENSIPPPVHHGDTPSCTPLTTSPLEHKKHGLLILQRRRLWCGQPVVCKKKNLLLRHTQSDSAGQWSVLPPPFKKVRFSFFLFLTKLKSSYQTHFLRYSRDIHQHK